MRLDGGLQLALAELRAQRDAVASGTFVNRTPRVPGEACAVMRVAQGEPPDDQRGGSFAGALRVRDFLLNSTAHDFLAEALAGELRTVSFGSRFEAVSEWSDRQPGPEPVLAALDRAIGLVEAAIARYEAASSPQDA